jgi:hypothetical protein
MTVFLDTGLCALVETGRRFRSAYCFCHQSYQRPTTQKTVIHIHTHHRENLKYHKYQEVQIDLQIGHLLSFLRMNTYQVMILILRINTVRFQSVYIILTL